MSLASWRTLFPNSHIEGIVDLAQDAEYQIDRDKFTEPDAIRASGCPPEQGIKPATIKRNPTDQGAQAPTAKRPRAPVGKEQV